MNSGNRENVLGPILVGMLAALVTLCVVRFTAYVPLTPLQIHFAKNIVPTPLPIVSLDGSCNAWKAPGDLAIYPTPNITVSQGTSLPSLYDSLHNITLGNIAILGKSGEMFMVSVDFNSATSEPPQPITGYVKQDAIFPWGRLNSACAQLGITWKDMNWVVDS